MLFIYWKEQYFTINTYFHNDSNLLTFSDLTRVCEGAMMDDTETLDSTENHDDETSVL